MIIFSYFLFISADWFYAFLISSSLTHVLKSHSILSIVSSFFNQLSCLSYPTHSPPPPPIDFINPLTLHRHPSKYTLFIIISPKFLTLSLHFLNQCSHHTFSQYSRIWDFTLSSLSFIRLAPPLTRPTCSTLLIQFTPNSHIFLLIALYPLLPTPHSLTLSLSHTPPLSDM